jgi:integrase
MDLILKNLVSRVKFLRENNEQTRVVSREEKRLYLMACSQQLRDLAQIMIETGMRPEEICRLEKCNVNLEKNYVFVPHGKTKVAPKNSFIEESERGFKFPYNKH